jgi:hypothetical protein
MNRPRAVVLVHLPDRYVRDHAGDGHIDTRVLQRKAVDRGIAILDEEERRKCLVSRRPVHLCRCFEWHQQGADDEKEYGVAGFSRTVIGGFRRTMTAGFSRTDPTS